MLPNIISCIKLLSNHCVIMHNSPLTNVMQHNRKRQDGTEDSILRRKTVGASVSLSLSLSLYVCVCACAHIVQLYDIYITACLWILMKEWFILYCWFACVIVVESTAAFVIAFYLLIDWICSTNWSNSCWKHLQPLLISSWPMPHIPFCPYWNQTNCVLISENTMASNQIWIFVFVPRSFLFVCLLFTKALKVIWPSMFDSTILCYVLQIRTSP